MCCASWLNRCGCINHKSFQKFLYTPWFIGYKWVYKRLVKDKFFDQQVEKNYMKINPLNLCKEDIAEDKIKYRPEIKHFITTERFHKYIGSINNNKNIIDSCDND